jgi:uncharacterized damage-inducible protein DinB
VEHIAEVPYRVGEKETLLALLDMQRAAIVAVCDGCSDEDLRKRLVPSMTTILGIVKHLAYGEGWWIHTVFGGEAVAHPSTEGDPDADFRIEEHETTEEILAFYAAQCEKSRAIVAEADLDDVGTDPRPSCSKVVSLRWIIGRMIWETARHAGQADILREQLDGAAGLGHSGAPTID